jgi:peptidyl-prolyl cis-trans isomerase A (cyclophilin A)
MRPALAGVLAMMAGCSSTAPKENAAASGSPEKVVVPEKYRVRFDTTKGPFMMEIVREWAPRGADRFHELVRSGFYDGSRFFRVRPKFVVQFGISADPKSNELWRQLKLPDDPVRQSNLRGFVSYATDGPATRTTQVFVNLADNKRLDRTGFAPFGRVVEGMDVVDSLYSGYGEVQALGGGGPDAARLEVLGDEYAARSYPRLDQIKTARIVE